MPIHQRKTLARMLALAAVLVSGGLMLGGCTARQLDHAASRLHDANEKLSSAMPTTVAEGAGHGSAHLVYADNATGKGLHQKTHDWTSASCLVHDDHVVQWTVPDPSSGTGSDESLTGSHDDEGWTIYYTPSTDAMYTASPSDGEAKDKGPVIQRTGERASIEFHAPKLEALGTADSTYLSGTVHCGEMLSW